MKQKEKLVLFWEAGKPVMSIKMAKHKQKQNTEHQRCLSAFELKGSSIIKNREDQSARNESEQGETSSSQQSQKKSKKLKLSQPSTLYTRRSR